MTPTYEQHLAEIRKVHPELPEDKREALAQHRTETHEGHNNVLTVPQVPAAVVDTEAIGRIVREALDAYKFKPVIVREPQEPKVVYVDKPFPAVEYKIHELIREVVVEKPTLKIERVEVEKQVLVLDPHTTVVDRPVIVEKPAPRDRYRLVFRVIVLALLAGLLARTAHCQDPVQSPKDPVNNLVKGGGSSTLAGATDYTTNLVNPLALKVPLIGNSTLTGVSAINPVLNLTQPNSSGTAVLDLHPKSSGFAIRSYQTADESGDIPAYYLLNDGGFATRAYVYISGHYTGSGASYRLTPVSADPHMLSINPDVATGIQLTASSRANATPGLAVELFDYTQTNRIWGLWSDAEMCWGTGVTRGVMDVGFFRASANNLKLTKCDGATGGTLDAGHYKIAGSDINTLLNLATIRPASDSTSAILVQNAANGLTFPLAQFDTTNSRVGWNVGAPGAAFHLKGGGTDPTSLLIDDNSNQGASDGSIRVRFNSPVRDKFLVQGTTYASLLLKGNYASPAIFEVDAFNTAVYAGTNSSGAVLHLAGGVQVDGLVIGTTGALTTPFHHSTTGTLYLCVSTTGVVSAATVCTGT